MCVIAVVWPGGGEITAEGRCNGLFAIFIKEQADSDMIRCFYLPEFGKTMAELSMEEKNKISHRGKSC